LPSSERAFLIEAIVVKVTVQYKEAARELLELVQKTSATLRKLQQKNQSNLGTGIGGVFEKIKIHLFLDIRKYGEECASLGAKSSGSELESLRQLVSQKEGGGS